MARFPFPSSSTRRRSRSPQAAVCLLLLAAILYAVRHRTDSTASNGPGSRVLYPVLGVTDGDTLRVEYQGHEERIRLLRINTPERGAPGSKQATDCLKRWVQGKTVALEFEHPGQEERDIYKRLLAYVFVDETNVNLDLVRQGWSRFYDRHGEGRYGDLFRQAEEEARAAKRGIWILEAE